MFSMEDITIPSIYAIVNTLNGKRYIGSAVNPSKRYQVHLCLLQRGSHYNAHLQNSWSKYGKDSFCFHIVEAVGNPSFLIPQEQAWMDFYTSYDPKLGYNLCPTAGSNLGRTFSEEARRNNSQAQKGKVLSKECRRKISLALTGQNHPNYGKTRSKATCKKISKTLARKWEVINPKGISQIVENLDRFCKDNELTSTCMYRVASGKQSHHKGWVVQKIRGDM